MREQLLNSAQRLHAYLLRQHYTRGLLHGPDSGVRFNLRAWRFLRSALAFLPWGDDYIFTQTQGYWVLANWMLFEVTGDRLFREIALQSTEATLGLETPQGYWAYPLPERKHLIATLEGIWGAGTLLATFAREPRREFLDGAIRAYDFIVSRIGFQNHPCGPVPAGTGRGKAINYFDRPRGKVPNNSVIAAWLFLRLWKTTGDGRFLEHLKGLLDFIEAVQLPSGEIPYIVESPYERARQHYLCFQYNAYQFLHLAWSRRLKPDAVAEPILARLARFLQAGVKPTGACANNCASAGRGGGREVDYYTAALGAALHEAGRTGLIESTSLSERCYARALARQRPDGSFAFSTGDYGFLRDQRSYPRPQAMTLFHLLYGCDLGDGFKDN
jgi:hypothetical protein